MSSEVFVTKTTFINILGPSAINVAAFLTGDSVEGKSLKFLFENVESLDLNCDLVKFYIVPALQSSGSITQVDVDRINQYIATALN